MELQGCMPADIATMGYPIAIGSQQAINRAFDAWQKKRGIATFSTWKNRPRTETPAPKQPKQEKPKQEKPPKAPKPPKEPPIKVPRAPRVDPAEARARMLARKKAYRLANKERARADNRAYQQRRRAAMTPEERKAESEKVNSYRKLAKAKKEAAK